MYIKAKNNKNTISYNNLKEMSSNRIHPTAIIEDGAVLGKNVEIGAFCVIGNNVVIGDNCKIKPHVVIEGNTAIGKDNKIFSFVVIGQQPQDLKYEGEPSRIEIGDNNSIREHCTIHPGTKGDNMLTKIGNNNLLMVGAHIAHDCVIGDNCVLANNVTLAGHVYVDDFAVIGGLSGVHQFVRIGKHAMVGGMTAVERDVIPYGLAIGERRTSLEGINLVGLKRRDFTKDEMDNLRHFYKEAFCVDGSNLFELVESLKENYKDCQVVNDIIDFVMLDSKRHITVKNS